MHKAVLKKVVGMYLAVMSSIVILSGCGRQTSGVETSTDAVGTPAGDAEIIQASEAAETRETAEGLLQAPFFMKGVYCSYEQGAEDRDYFYVFYDEGAGYTEDGNNGIGLPFSCEQKDNKVIFSFGGEDEESRQELVVKSAENGIVTGEFDEDGIELVFELLSNADPDNFSSMEYMGKSGGSDEAVYNDPNGWSVRYAADDFEVTTEGSVTTFVYIGESAGTNMITAAYVLSKDAETYINELARSWGSENVTVTKSIFPGTDAVDGYWASLLPAEDGSGLYETAVARDYMDGALVFELTGHHSGNDEMDIPVSDKLAAIIDSIVFSAESDNASSDVFSEDQALDAVINYYKNNNPGYESGKEAGDYWDVSTNDSGEIVVLYHSYTGVINRYYVDPDSGETYVTELVPGIIDEEQKMDEAFNIRDYLNVSKQK